MSKFSNKEFKPQTQMTNDQSNPNFQNPKQKYAPEERTAKFSEDIVERGSRTESYFSGYNLQF